MILYVNGSVRHPVFDCVTGKYYGRITAIMVDDGFKEILGFVTRTRIFRPYWAFESKAVRLANKDLLLVERKGKRWLPLNRVIHDGWKRAKKAQAIKVLEEGGAAGEVTDFAFDSETGRVLGILVGQSLLGKLVFVPQSDIVMAGGEGILVKKGALGKSEPPKPTGSMLGGLLKAAARTLGTEVAKAKVTAKQRTASSLRGKAAPSAIKDAEGNVIISEGDLITEEAVRYLEEADRLSETSLVMMGKRFGAALASANKRLKKRS